MCRTRFSLFAAPDKESVDFFVEMPARVVKGDSVTLWPLMPVEMAARHEHFWLQNEGVFEVDAACWSRDAHGIYLAATLWRQPS